MSIQDIVKRAVLALGFEERAGLIAFDSSPKHNNGTLGAGAAEPTWVAGKDGFGGAVDFDGDNDYVVVPYNASFNTKKVTVIAWIYHNNATGSLDGGIAKGVLFGAFEWSLAFHAGQARWDVSAVNNRVSGAVSTGWNMWVGTYDEAVSRFYKNGTQIKEVEGVGDIRGTSDITIGGDSTGSAFAINGIIDDVLILPYALTPAEIRALYDSRSLFTATPNLRRGLVLDLDLQEGAGLTAFDRSINANNGTIVGNPAWAKSGGRTCLDFDGDTDRIQLASTIVFGVTDPWTIVATIVDELAVAKSTVWIGANRTRPGLMLSSGSERKPLYREVDTGTYYDFLTEAQYAPYLNTEAVHVYVADGTGSLKGYINGLLMTEFTGLDTRFWVDSVGAGYLYASTLYVLDGKLLSVKVYNRALSGAEVRALTEEWS